MKENIFKKLIRFIKEAIAELKKVSWPGKKQVMGSTGLIIVMIIIFALFLGLIDFILSKILGLFL